MEAWEDWTLSAETENRLRDICSKLPSDKSHEISKAWLELFNHGSPPIRNSSINKMEVSFNEGNSKEEEIINLIKESVQSDTSLPESKLSGISYNSLNKILLSIKDSLNDTEFSNFCKLIASWNNNVLVEDSLKLIVLPKLREKREASTCVIFALKELAMSKPDEVCNNVLIPLLTDESFEFTDIELFIGVFSALQSAPKDLLIKNLTSKKDFQESDWLLLQPLVKGLSNISITNIESSICKFSSKFTKSKVFGRFLVNFCENIDSLNDKNLLLEAINKHQTLLKRQALKYLESI